MTQRRSQLIKRRISNELFKHSTLKFGLIIIGLISLLMIIGYTYIVVSKCERFASFYSNFIFNRLNLSQSSFSL